MKKIFITSLLLLLMGSGGLFAQGRVVETQILSANYAATPPTVTFEVSWASTPTPPMHRDTVWVFIDYALIGDDGTIGAWTPASLTAVAPPAGDGHIVPGSLNGRGFYLDGHNFALPFSATLTVTLSADLNGKKFNWCAYATDYPPNAVEENGHYRLNGTPPFRINNGSVTEYTRQYAGGCIDDLTDATGCPGWVPEKPNVTAFTALPAAVCAGNPVTLTATANSTTTEYYFDDGHGGGSWTSNATTVVYPTVATTYSVQVRSLAGCSVTSPLTRAVSILPKPTPAFVNPPPTACPGTMTLTATGGGSYCFSQSCADCIHNPYLTGNNTDDAADCQVLPVDCQVYGTSSSYVVQVPESGSVTVWVRVKNGDGCIDSTSIVIRVLENCVGVSPSLDPQSRVQELCLGEAIAPIVCPTFGITDESQLAYGGTLPAGLTRVWDDNSVLINGTPTETGVFIYTMTPTGGAVGSSVAGTITVNALPTVTSVNSSAACGSTATTLTAVVANATVPASYTWNVEGYPTVTTDANTFACTYTSPLTYTVQVRNANGCVGAVSPTGTISAAGPVASVTAHAPEVCNGTAVTFTATVSSGSATAMTYTWILAGASYTTTVGTFSRPFSGTGAKTYSLSVKTGSGCSSTPTAPQTVTIIGPSTNGQAENACGCAAGLTNCDGTCSNNCAYWDVCDGFSWVSEVPTEGAMTLGNANTHCANKGAGWRLPNIGELQCMCANKDGLPGGYDTSRHYWSTTYGTAASNYIVLFSSCATVYGNYGGASGGNIYNFKCVK